MSVNWFPGHMVKARKEIKENLKLVDVVVEVVDARAPASTRNPELEKMCGHKPVLLVLNKMDLADADGLKEWLNRLRREKTAAVAVNSASREGVSAALKAVSRLYEPAARVMVEKSRRVRPARVMVVGVPNVGKSTFLNAAVGRKMAPTGPKPGVTRGKQWVRAQGDIDFLDTPGLMWPRIESPEQGLKLACLGLVGEKAYREREAVLYLLAVLRGGEPAAIETLAETARGMGLDPGDASALDRAAWRLLADFRQGRMGRVMLDLPS